MKKTNVGSLTSAKIFDQYALFPVCSTKDPICFTDVGFKLEKGWQEMIVLNLLPRTT